jgi:endoglucanase
MGIRITLAIVPFLLLHLRASVGQNGSAPLVLPSELPLGISGRYIMAANNTRVKLACVNWVGHMGALLPESLATRPIQQLADGVPAMGFNCVRLTYAVETIQRRDDNATNTARSVLSDVSYARLMTNNPWIANGTVWDCFQRLIEELAERRVMVIMDNHISDAEWCCSLEDSQRWFQKSRFPAQPWIDALAFVAGFLHDRASVDPRYRYVVGMGLRNELMCWDPFTSVPQWRQYMGQAAATVHAADPDLLIVAGGLTMASQLDFIKKGRLEPRAKVVYEAHIYNNFYVHPGWVSLGQYPTCAYLKWFLTSRVGVVLDVPAPLWLSEFGFDVDTFDPGNTNGPDNQWFLCIIEWLEQYDVDWAVWVLHGVYYDRDGQKDSHETFGLTTEDYRVKNTAFLDNLHRVMQVKAPDYV